MEAIKIKRRISSSTLRIRELEKFINKYVQISIAPIEKKDKNRIEELLSISQWDITENDVRIKSWPIPKY